MVSLLEKIKKQEMKTWILKFYSLINNRLIYYNNTSIKVALQGHGQKLRPWFVTLYRVQTLNECKITLRIAVNAMCLTDIASSQIQIWAEHWNFASI